MLTHQILTTIRRGRYSCCYLQMGPKEVVKVFHMMVPTTLHTSYSPEEPVTQNAVSDPVGLGWGPRICISTSYAVVLTLLIQGPPFVIRRCPQSCEDMDSRCYMIGEKHLAGRAVPRPFRMPGRERAGLPFLTTSGGGRGVPSHDSHANTTASSSQLYF